MPVIRLFSFLAAVLVLTACASGGASPKTASAGGSAAQASDAAAIASAMDAATAPFVASRKSRKYYPAACHTVKLIKAVDQLGFASQKDAETAGFAKDLYSTDCQY